MIGFREIEIRYQDKLFSNDKLLLGYSCFFDVFSCEFIAGNPKLALVEARSLILTESIAKTYFGDEDAFNKVVELTDESYRITGIIKDWPINSHFHFDILGSFTTKINSNYDITKDNGFNFYTY